MQTIEFKRLFKAANLKNFSVLRVNTNGYPFVTVMNANNRATNLYFSKNASGLVLDTFGEGKSVKNYLQSASVVKTENEAGEMRYKITSQGEYETFEDVETEIDFDLALFAKEFESQTVTTA